MAFGINFGGALKAVGSVIRGANPATNLINAGVKAAATGSVKAGVNQYARDAAHAAAAGAVGTVGLAVAPAVAGAASSLAGATTSLSGGGILGFLKRAVAPGGVSEILDSAEARARAAAQRIGASAGSAAATPVTSAFWSSPTTKRWLIGGAIALVVLIAVIVYLARRR